MRINFCLSILFDLHPGLCCFIFTEATHPSFCVWSKIGHEVQTDVVPRSKRDDPVTGVNAKTMMQVKCCAAFFYETLKKRYRDINLVYFHG
jgi:hypothetical protein